MSGLLSELKLIYDPVKRQDQPEQIRTAVVLAKVRHLAHIMITGSIVGSLAIVVGFFVKLPWSSEIVLISVTPTLFLMGFFAMNRVVHKEKEFKRLEWRKRAIESGDEELGRLFRVPFPVSLRRESAERLAIKLKGLAENNLSKEQEELIRKVTEKAVEEVVRHLGETWRGPTRERPSSQLQ